MSDKLNPTHPAPDARAKRVKARRPKAKVRDWKPAFLKALGEFGVVRYACAAARIDRSTAYAAQQADETFAAAWQNALEEGIDSLEQEAWRRARDGTSKPVFFQGIACGEIQEYSDSLLMFLLRAHRPKKFTELVKSEITGADGKPLEVRDVTDISDDELKRIASGGSAGTIGSPPSPSRPD